MGHDQGNSRSLMSLLASSSNAGAKRRGFEVKCLCQSYIHFAQLSCCSLDGTMYDASILLFYYYYYYALDKCQD